MKINIEQPQPDELEITTLGPGPSSGESIVVHLRNDEWIIELTPAGERQCLTISF